MVASGIYGILNTTNGKVYVGSAINLKKRWGEHKRMLKGNYHPNKYLQSAWKIDNFVFVILEYIDDRSKLVSVEQLWMDATKSNISKFGYNLRPYAISQLGFKHTDESKELISKVKIGTRISEETKIKMSEVRKGKKQSKEWIEKRAAANRGNKLTKEHIELISKRNRKLSKWPCEDGWKCKCDSCRTIRNKMRQYNREGVAA